MFNQVNIISPILKSKVIDVAKKNQSAYAGRSKKNLSPSSDYLCMKKSYFNFKFSGNAYMEPSDDEFSYENERAKEVGNKFHDFIQMTLTNAGVVKLCETTLADEDLHIRARLDLILEIHGQLYLVELKSAKQYSVKLMQQDGSPDLEHQKQLQLYFHLYDKNKNNPDIFEKLQGRPLNKGIILYEDKDGHKITEFAVNRSKLIIDDLIHYSKVLWAHVQAGEEPNFKFEPDSKECLYKCKPQYYLLCHGKSKENFKKKEDITSESGLWGISDARQLSDGDKFI
jgi:hypothetical protein